jgi:acetoin utilization deacetylase AcuC-like enzyme
MLDPDTFTSAQSFDAALLAAGGLLALVEATFAGKIEAGLALVRPPGHHAEAGRGMGFCLFNNIAVAAQAALRRHGCRRVMIVDWDLHHGNGTQHSFEEDDQVLYFSCHQYPYYPGTGGCYEVGRGRGTGYTVNVPLGLGHGDGEYIQIMTRLVEPLADEFKPELILVSAGFDIYAGDPLGGQKVTTRGFAALARFTAELAARHCPGRHVITLEGGYHIQGQADSILAMIRELSGVQKLGPDDLRDNPDAPDIKAVASVRALQAKYWSCFKE